jgi:hypothetical protein
MEDERPSTSCQEACHRRITPRRHPEIGERLLIKRSARLVDHGERYHSPIQVMRIFFDWGTSRVATDGRPLNCARSHYFESGLIRCRVIGNQKIGFCVRSAAPNASNKTRLNELVCGSCSACHWTPRANEGALVTLIASIVPSSATPSTTIR